MSNAINELLLAAMQRAGKPLDSGQLLDEAIGLCAAEGWSDEAQALLTRKSIARRLTLMEASGVLVSRGGNFDRDASRMTPCYQPAKGFDPHARAPEQPESSKARRPPPAHKPYDNMDRMELMAVLEVQDEMLQNVARFLSDMSVTRERSRTRLAVAGLGAA